MKLQLNALLALCFLFSCKLFSQDFIRIGAAHDFKKNKVVQTFSFDLNRTEKIDEKIGSYLLFGHDNFYVLPSIDLNVGDGVSSSENNILVQLNMGKAFYGKLNKKEEGLKTTVWNKAIEFNPSYNSDKLFEEKLLFGQFKFLLNHVTSKHTSSDSLSYLKSASSISIGLFSNLGNRSSKTFEQNNFYFTSGFLLDYKIRVLNAEKVDNWVYKITGNYYHINSDISLLAVDDFGGLIKTSVDKLLNKKYYLSLSYKYGNDNPSYKYFHVLELSAKIKF